MEENVYKEVFERTLRAEDVDYKVFVEIVNNL